VKKKKIVLISILIIAELFLVINPVKAFSYNLISLELNRDTYFIDEKIKVNASWDLFYNPANEIAYTQIHILDSFDQIIWNSSKYNEIGTFDKNLTINIQDLSLESNNSSVVLYVGFFLFYFHTENLNTIRQYLEMLEIRVNKRNISCELIGYKDRIKFGEFLNFSAQFFDETANGTQIVNNQTINFIISSSGLVIHENDYITNDSGTINFNLSSLTDLRLGENQLRFSIYDDPVYNNVSFIYSLFVEKYQLKFEIITFRNELKKNEDLELILFCYYDIDQIEIPLASQNLLIEIFDNNTIIYTAQYKTNAYGILDMAISHGLFVIDQNSIEFTLRISFNGTESIEKGILNLNFNIDNGQLSDLANSLQVRILSFSSVLIVIFIILSYVIFNKKSKNEKLLSELVIRY
jgi:hypothetical protein